MITKRMILAITMVKFASGGGSYFPYILLNEIKTMFSQLSCKPMRDIIFSIIELFPLLARFSPLKYLLCEKYTVNIRWPPRKVTALQVVRTSFLGPRPRLFPSGLYAIMNAHKIWKSLGENR